ncbi:hypothetical protein [Halosimplex pelagicum]|uniref:Uncharacterized protein n=1 Tax=Halosimplex pelagicum TaxID=869886 RepID=A0A7D5P9L1_9EURY|nr:hypothetical protein [Halosimplex pelagicum]QLH84166.1 hypothetical protein HZS54_22120 [Halosimplex pelagicum]
MPSLLERLLGDGDTDEGIDLQKREDEAHEALQNRITPETYGIDDCAVTGVAVVNEGPDEEPITVPIARFSLGEDVESPDLDLVWELASEAIRAMQPAFEEVFVRHYDVQFTFDGDELFEAEECRRMAVTPELADRLVSETGFDAAAFKSAMLEADDIDDRVAPVAWGECVDYSASGNAAVVTGAAAAAAGASAAGASCAGAGAAGGAGGC